MLQVGVKGTGEAGSNSVSAAVFIETVRLETYGDCLVCRRLLVKCVGCGRRGAIAYPSHNYVLI